MPTLRIAALALAFATATLADPPARYQVRALGLDPPRFAVHAELAIDGTTLLMETTRPFGIPELDANGWPGVVAHLRVATPDGELLPTAFVGASGWRLVAPHQGRIVLDYEVDLAPLARLGWPAPRESAFADAGAVVLVGRALFVTTEASGASEIAFTLPPGWQAATPWEPLTAGFRARERADLVDNLFVLSKREPDVLAAGGFRLLVTPMGAWETARAEVLDTLRRVVERFVAQMAFAERDQYLVVLLPIPESGGESFRQSFAMTTETPPTAANRPDWANTIAHEVFHYWNGWRLRGADYAASQWFQEGFTEYAANTALVATGVTTPAQFLERLETHVARSRELTTPPDSPGKHKGRPLYSTGALVAFLWDLQIRQATQNQRSLTDFLRALWKQTDDARRPYTWEDIEAALAATAPGDWSGFRRRYLQGSAPLPVEEVLRAAGLDWPTAVASVAR